MRSHEAIVIVFLYIVSFVFGILVKLYFLNPHIYVFLLFGVFTLVYVFNWIYKYLESSGIKYAYKKLLHVGRGVPRSFIKKQMLAVEISLLGIIATVTYTLVIAPKAGFSPILPVVLAGFAILLAVSLSIIRIRASITASFRKTSVEVELPFLLAFMKSLSGTHLSFYDMLNVIEDSVALKAWAREVKLAKRIAALMNISLLRAMSVISEMHPSETVRDVFKRIVTVGDLTGTVREVVDRVFSYIFEKLEERLRRLVDKLDLIDGVVLFVFLFMPIVLATIVPITGGGILSILFLSVSTEIPTIFMLYALLSHIYPSGFVVNPPKTLLVLSSVSVSLVLVFIGIYLKPVVEYALVPSYSIIPKSVEPGMSETLLYVLIFIALLPATIYSELIYRKVSDYAKLLRAATDAAEISASLGENFPKTFERTVARYGERIHRLAKMIIEGYKSDIFRKAVVLKAPSIFHATFIETLLYTLYVGAPPSALKALTKTYEALTNLWERTTRITRTLEGMIMSLSAMLGFFITYLEKMFKSFYDMIAHSAQGAMGATVVINMFRFDPNAYCIISSMTLISILVVSLFTGKTRGGSLCYGLRTALISMSLYSVIRTLVSIFVQSPIPTT